MLTEQGRSEIKRKKKRKRIPGDIPLELPNPSLHEIQVICPPKRVSGCKGVNKASRKFRKYVREKLPPLSYRRNKRQPWMFVL